MRLTGGAIQSISGDSFSDPFYYGISYNYDTVGNRTASHLSANYSYQPFNKLTSTANATYRYDNNGNLISKTNASGTTTFAFNEENQLTQVVLPNTSTVNYKYDGLGRRIQRTTTTGASERYIYDGNDALIDLNADWSVANTYLNDLGIDNHLRQTNSTTGASYFLTDHLGSTAALTDASGNIVEQNAYDSFGNSGGSARTRYGYTGRERDPDTGMLYYRSRFYDPQVGRFISEDPIGLGGGVNGYLYTRNNPLTRKDPSGLYDIDVHYYLTYYWQYRLVVSLIGKLGRLLKGINIRTKMLIKSPVGEIRSYGDGDSPPSCLIWTSKREIGTSTLLGHLQKMLVARRNSLRMRRAGPETCGHSEPIYISFRILSATATMLETQRGVMFPEVSE